MAVPLSTADLGHLRDVVVHSLRTGLLPPPDSAESEPGYTARAILPLLRATLENFNTSGLLLAGDGGAPVSPAWLFGRSFYPDATVHYFSQRALACEVKVLRGAQTQNSLATALGQASIYHEAGYPHAVLVLIDPSNQLKPVDVMGTSEALARHGSLSLVVRSAAAGRVSPHPN